MSWVKIDDGAPEHPKLLSVGAAAAWLWVCGLAYCNRQKRRDGFIPFAKVKLLYPGLGTKHAETLVRAGLWELTSMGFNVHDYHEYQPDADAAEELRSARSAAGRLGGQRSGEARRKQPNEANAKQVASEDVKQTPSNHLNPVPSRPDPVPDPEHTQRARTREDPLRDSFDDELPDDWQPTAENAELAKKLGLDLAEELGLYRARRKRDRFKCGNWPADFEGWLRTAKKFDRQREAKQAPPPGLPDHEQAARAERVQAQALRGEWGKRAQQDAQAGTLDVDALLTAIQRGKVARREPSVMATPGRLGALVAQVGKVMP